MRDALVGGKYLWNRLRGLTTRLELTLLQPFGADTQFVSLATTSGPSIME